jgi:hypothetical protein
MDEVPAQPSPSCPAVAFLPSRRIPGKASGTGRAVPYLGILGRLLTELLAVSLMDPMAL